MSGLYFPFSSIIAMVSIPRSVSLMTDLALEKPKEERRENIKLILDKVLLVWLILGMISFLESLGNLPSLNPKLPH